MKTPNLFIMLSLAAELANQSPESSARYSPLALLPEEREGGVGGQRYSERLAAGGEDGGWG